MTRTSRKLRDAARTVFGHEHLLPGQADAAGALLDGHDVLLVSPTGSGKSLVYQLAGTLRDGVTLVVSPLLALQQDQVEGIEAGTGLRAARLSSAESAADRDAVLEAVAAGELDFLFLAPEQLANADVRKHLAACEPGLVAVDEAHCVSAWGHDFRPDYFRLGDLLADLGPPRLVALTATAAPPVRDDILTRLRMRDARTVVTGFARDNIALSVLRCVDEEDQRAKVLDAVAAVGKRDSGIVYCRTRPATEEYAEALGAAGRRTAVYHAGLGHRRREEVHRAFLDGAVDTIVATSAFGMGIDKPDVRFVVHAQAPESPDTYYQEVGRAGRDGEPARAVLAYRPEDLALGRFFSAGVPRPADVRAVLKALEEAGADGDQVAATDPAVVAAHAPFGRRKAGRLLNLLQVVDETGAADDGGSRVDAVVQLAESHRQLERSRVEMMRAYAETDRCRMEFLVGYFGEPLETRCGLCDSCTSGTAPHPATRQSGPFAAQDRVEHPEFGRGVVTDVEEDRLTVLFDDVGYRTLSLDVVQEQGLLRPSST